MHEHALINDLFRKINTTAEQHRATRVRKVSVWLGALCHISPEHFREHFEHTAPETRAAGAQLELEVSDDLHHPNAQQLYLTSLELDIPDGI
ncbi:MAG: hydrogenase/urease maturation nickel metallochaperone HypA [Myxococcota bacterium]